MDADHAVVADPRVVACQNRRTQPDARLATPADFPTLARTLGRAFLDDPVTVWLLPRARRLERVVTMYELSLEVQDGWGEVYTTPDGVGAAIWSPPGRWQPPPESMVTRAAKFREVFGRNLSRAGRISAAMTAHHPTEPHWYLGVVGTHPDWQRRGVGGALLAPVLARCDAEGLPAYLESSKQSNIAYYRRFGFELQGTVVVPSGGPTLWPMWRDPKS